MPRDKAGEINRCRVTGGLENWALLEGWSVALRTTGAMEGISLSLGQGEDAVGGEGGGITTR